MKKPAAPTNDPALLAVLHRSGKAWHVLIARVQPGTGAVGGVSGTGKPAVMATREFPLDHADRIDAFLAEQQVGGSVFCVLPASSVICRTVPLPNAAPEQLEPALRLQAEAHLLGIAPPHRLAMAVLPSTAGETARSGLILAWPQSSSSEAEFIAPVTSRPVRYVPDVAALAALLNGQRPTEPMLWLDRGDGSVAIAVTHASGAIFRATREEATDLDAWQKSVGRIVAETALSVGHTGGYIESAVVDTRAKASSIASRDAALFLPREVIESARSRIDGAGEDRKWWHKYGIAAGAALVAIGDLAPLSHLMHTPPVEAPSRVRNTLEALSRPRAAATVIAAAVALLLLGPIVFAGLRLAVLKVRYGDVQTELEAARSAKAQLAVYKELARQDTWPMTKLLSDIATNAPLGIEFDSVRLEGGKDFSISGTGIARDGRTPPEIFSQMRDNLYLDKLFDDITINWDPPNNLGVYKFAITGKVTRPYESPEYPVERDFARYTHEMRRDGKPPPGSPQVASSGQPEATSGETPTTAAPLRTAAAEGATDEALAEAASDEPMIANADSADTETETRSGTSGPLGPRPSGVGDDPTLAPEGVIPAGAIPPPITKEEIEAMSEAELRQALDRVSKARQYAPKTDKELSDRLKNEFNMLMDQLRKVKDA